ncbi:MAG: tetratricopeptide repeat-containing sensor histidine kinase [Bacteroidales bacterium]|nr:tetratricopeptide repeat-containing sensor histidine kinase [Bacteroidales bacterium]
MAELVMIRKKKILLVILFLFTTCLFSQKPLWNYDSLQTVINNTNSIEEKQFASALYAYKFFRTKPDSARLLLNNSAPILQSDNYQAISEYYSAMGTLNWFSKNPDSAMFYFHKAYQLSLSNRFDQINANAAGYVGMLFKIKGNIDSALYYLQHTINVCDRINNSYLANKAHYDIAAVYSQLGKHEISLRHYLAALKIQEEDQDSVRIIYTYNGLGNAYKNLKKKEKSRSYYLKSIRLDSLSPKVDQRVNNYTNLGLLYESSFKNIDSALFYYFSAMHLMPENDISSSKIVLLVNIGNAYYARLDFRKALNYYNESMQYDYTRSNPYLTSAILINKSLIYFELHKYDSAYALGREGLRLAEKIKAPDWQINAHQTLFRLDSACGKFNNAIEHLQAKYAIIDTVYNKDNLNRVSELEVIYETEKKDALNKSLLENNTLAQRVIKNQRYIILSVIVTCCLFILLVFSVLRSGRKQRIINRKLKLVNEESIEKNKVIDEKNQLLIEQNQQLTKLNETKDKFFSVISHDLRGPFNALLGYLELLNTEYDSLSEPDKKNMLKAIHKSSTNTYNLLVNLLDWARTQRGLIVNESEVLDMYEITDSSIDIVKQRADNKSQQLMNEVPSKIFVKADLNLISSVMLNLLNNAIKFSPRGGVIRISCETKNEFITVHIHDQGVGIPKEQQMNLFDIGNATLRQGTENELGTGMGLVLVREFIQLMGGDIWVSSEEGKGSVFSFTLPLNQA